MDGVADPTNAQSLIAPSKHPDPIPAFNGNMVAQASMNLDALSFSLLEIMDSRYGKYHLTAEQFAQMTTMNRMLNERRCWRAMQTTKLNSVQRLLVESGLISNKTAIESMLPSLHDFLPSCMWNPQLAMHI
jgi:hypothetical protein